MVMLLLGRVPSTGDYADWLGWRFEVVDMDEKRIDKILASPRPDGECAAGIYVVTVFIVGTICWIRPAPLGAGFDFYDPERVMAPISGSG